MSEHPIEASGSIVCALDLQQHAGPLVRLAGQWAAALGTSVSLLHADPPAPATFGSLPVELVSSLREYEALIAAARGDRDQQIERLAKSARAKGMACESVVVKAHPADAILEHARDVGAALIIVGPHSSPVSAEWLQRAGVGRRFLGGVASHVLRSAVCPVLVACGVEGDAPLPSPAGRWVVGLDESEDAEAALAWVTRHAGRASAEVLLVNVVERLHQLGDASSGIWAHLRERAEELIERRVPARAESRVEIGRPADVLIEASVGTSMLVLGRGGRRDSRIGAVARRCLRRADVPVLVVPRV